MGRFSEKTTAAQRMACAVEKLDHGRSGESIARDGIPGVLEPGFITAAMVNEYARRELRRRRRGETGALVEEYESVLWELLEDLQTARISWRRKPKRTAEELRQIVSTAKELGTAIGKPAQREEPDSGKNQPEEKPSTLAAKLATGGKDTPDGDNGSASGGVQSSARAVELLNKPARNGSQ